MKAFVELIMGDPQADRVVPPAGSTARLTVFVAAVMAFLAVMAVAMSLTVGRTAGPGDAGMAQSATVRLLGWIVILLIAASVAAMITLAAQAALAANIQVISVLRLVGARDAYIARAFVRRYTLRTLGGAGLGTILGGLVLLVMPQGSLAENGAFSRFGPQGGEWLWLLVIPLLSAIVAFVATRAAALRKLRELT